MGRIVGIDLGTTYSAVASVNELRKPEILVNREGERITPSVVLFQGDLTQVGSQAKRSASTAPDDVVQFVKRQIGHPDWRFTSNTGAEYTAEQISAIILKRLKEDAEIVLGEAVTDAVVTVPAYFDDARRRATLDAGAIAGLNVRRVLNEPTAAALSFGLTEAYSGTALVYDLGGGTFDVTVLRIDPELVDVLSTKGDRNLGGFDWDNRLMRLLNDRVQAAGGPDLFEDELLTAELRDKAESAKRTLSSLAEARLFMTADGRNFNLSVTRAEFEEATQDLLSMTEVIVEEAIEGAGLSWSAIDKVLLVGGSTRMPMVPDLIQRLSGAAPDRSMNPDEAVALGAAIQGQILAESEGGARYATASPSHASLAIADVTSQSLGVVALDDDGVPTNSVIIPSNTKIPAQRSGVYATVEDSQTQLHVQVTEGDDPDLSYVQVIHQEPLRIPPYPKGALIEVVMSYDVDATIHVQVRDLTAGSMLGEIELDRPSNLEPTRVAAMTDDMKKLEVY